MFQLSGFYCILYRNMEIWGMNVTHRLMALHCFRPKGACKGFLRAPSKDSLGFFRGSFKGFLGVP